MRSISTGEGFVSADRDPSSGAIALRSITPPSPTRGEGRKKHFNVLERHTSMDIKVRDSMKKA
jgi:hypothetical protein